MGIPKSYHLQSGTFWVLLDLYCTGTVKPSILYCMRIYPYLRASTDEQDATRAKATLSAFVERAGQRVSTWFVENESGATLKRPELFRLLDVAQEGDVLLIEQVDRISRLNSKDWESLKSTIAAKGIIIVSLDLPTSHQFMQPAKDEFTQRIAGGDQCHAIGYAGRHGAQGL